MVILENGASVLGGYWGNNDCRPIHEKEADAVLKSLQSLNGVLHVSRFEDLSDNMGVIGSRKNQGGKAIPLKCINKETVGFVVEHNVDLHLSYVLSVKNLAAALSRSFFELGRPYVSEKSWSMVE